MSCQGWGSDASWNATASLAEKLRETGKENLPSWSSSSSSIKESSIFIEWRLALVFGFAVCSIASSISFWRREGVLFCLLLLSLNSRAVSSNEWIELTGGKPLEPFCHPLPVCASSTVCQWVSWETSLFERLLESPNTSLNDPVFVLPLKFDFRWRKNLLDLLGK